MFKDVGFKKLCFASSDAVYLPNLIWMRHTVGASGPCLILPTGLLHKDDTEDN